MEHAMAKILVMAMANVSITSCQLPRFAVKQRTHATPTISALEPVVYAQLMYSKKREPLVLVLATIILAMLLTPVTAQANAWIDSFQALRSAVALKMLVMHLKCALVLPVSVQQMCTSLTSAIANLAKKPVTAPCLRILAKKLPAFMASVRM